MTLCKASLNLLVFVCVVGEVPVLGQSHRELNGAGPFGTQFTDTSCRTQSSDQTLYWYKDGVDITEHYNPSTHELVYSNSDVTLISGVYQCFVENNAGSDYFNVRVLPKCKSLACVACARALTFALMCVQCLLIHQVTSAV